MPAYSTFEILKSKFDYAIEHGTGHFGMSWVILLLINESW
jgi:hypothetical protein